MSNRRKVFEFVLSMKTRGAATWSTSQRGMAAFNREVRSGNRLLGTMQGRVLGLVGAYAGLSGISQMITSVLTGQKEVEIMARTAGLGVGDFQAYAYAVRSVGIESDKLADISKDVREKLGDFIATGGGEMADFFENIAPQVGLTAKELQNLSGPDVLIAVKKALDEANVSAEEQIFYLEGMASDASLLIPLLEKEGKVLLEQAAAAREMGIAISDLDAKQLKEVLKAVQVMQGALQVLQRDIVVALAPAIKQFSEGITENKEEIAEFAIGIADAAAAVAEYALKHQDLIVFLAKTTVGVLALAKAITTYYTLKRGINAMSLAMTGSQLIPYLATLRTSLLATASAGNILGAALLVGWSGKQVVDATNGFLAMRDAQNAAAAAAKRASISELMFAHTLKRISYESGVVVTNAQEMMKAFRDGSIVYDRTTDTYLNGSSEQAKAILKVKDAAVDSFTGQERISKETLLKMASAYQSYLGKVKGYQDELANREQSLAEKIREMNRGGMSDLGAWKDRKREAQEYEQAAKNAMEAGDNEKAKELADKAAAAYEDLNKKVEKNGKVVISAERAKKIAISGMNDAAEIATEALKKQEEAALDVADALDNASGGKLQELADISDEFGLSWEKAFELMELRGKQATDEIEKRLDELTRDREVNVYINEIEKHATGGSVGVMKFATGGTPAKFPRLSRPLITSGSGRRDDVPAMLTRKEFVQSVPAVDYYGVDAMEVLNRRQINRDDLRMLMGLRYYNQGGLAVPLGMRSAPVSLPSSNSGSGGGTTIHLTMTNTFTGYSSPMEKSNIENNGHQLISILESELENAS